jgi:hypothetical protein
LGRYNIHIALDKLEFDRVIHRHALDKLFHGLNRTRLKLTTKYVFGIKFADIKNVIVKCIRDQN